MIGKTEEVILLTLLRLGEAGPNALTMHINDVTPIRLGVVYTTLVRMVEKGWVHRRDGGNRSRGNPRSLFSILPAGQAALTRSLSITNRFVSGQQIDFG
jgi:DNA-binding PadR family transcriptional regulator